MSSCGGCGAVVDTGVTVCRRCGAQIPLLKADHHAWVQATLSWIAVLAALALLLGWLRSMPF